jgi:hypothetical protein
MHDARSEKCQAIITTHWCFEPLYKCAGLQDSLSTSTGLPTCHKATVHCIQRSRNTINAELDVIQS